MLLCRLLDLGRYGGKNHGRGGGEDRTSYCSLKSVNFLGLDKR